MQVRAGYRFGQWRGLLAVGFLVAWAVAVGFNFVGNGFKTSSWGSSTISFPLPSLVIK